MGYYSYYSTWIYLLPAILITVVAQIKVKSAYRKYSGIQNASHVTGGYVADKLLGYSGIDNVSIMQIGGQLTDNYNPLRHTLNLSQGVYGSTSIAAICIAAHECGHADQHHSGYFLLRIRNTIVPVVNLSSTLSWPILMVGLFIGSTGIFNLGIILFSAVVLFHLVTLPVELNASRRGLKMLDECGFLRNEMDKKGSKAVLKAAAMTYLGSLAMSLANLLRILAMRNSRRR